MIKGKTIGVVVPAYNEQLLIGDTLKGIPFFVDHIFIINDASTDKTREIILKLKSKTKKLFLSTIKITKGWVHLWPKDI